jgi:hypothetical protein
MELQVARAWAPAVPAIHPCGEVAAREQGSRGRCWAGEVHVRHVLLSRRWRDIVRRRCCDVMHSGRRCCHRCGCRNMRNGRSGWRWWSRSRPTQRRGPEKRCSNSERSGWQPIIGSSTKQDVHTNTLGLLTIGLPRYVL